jgi:diadenosine tetraphosphate (Ap4A) HIT family hydrolase
MSPNPEFAWQSPDAMAAAGVRGCPFCELPPGSIIEQNQHALAFRDRYPLAPGHVLVIPRRHVGSPFDLNTEELVAVWSLVAQVRRALAVECSPTGSPSA